MKRPVPVGRSPARTLCDASEKPIRTRVAKNRDQPVLMGDLGRETQLRKGLFRLSACLRYDYVMITITPAEVSAQGGFVMFMKSLVLIVAASCFVTTAWAQDDDGDTSSDSSSSADDSMGADFSAVRVHTDSAAGDLADSLGGRAFTYRNDVGLGGSTSSDGGLMAHELTHAVQQQQSTATEEEDSDDQEEDAEMRVRQRVPLDTETERRRVRRSPPDDR
jgi:hypothetical protein